MDSKFAGLGTRTWHTKRWHLLSLVFGVRIFRPRTREVVRGALEEGFTISDKQRAYLS